MGLYLSQLNELWGEPVFNHKLDLFKQIGPICTDSRKVRKGSFFVPLIGERFNGHSFLYQAFLGGAQAALVSKDFIGNIPKELPHWLVDDTLMAYQQLALLHRCDLNIPVVAVTGSVGKTTTRAIIKEVLTPLGPIHSTAGNNNNDVGVPLTLLDSTESDSAIVVEMGMRGQGEIRRLSCCCQPDIAVITNIGTAHIGLLGSRENIAVAKCEITSFLKASGVVVIPANEPILEKALSDVWKGRVIKVAIKEERFLDGSLSSSAIPSQALEVDILGLLDLSKGLLKVEKQIFQLPLEGKHNAQNFLLALAVAKELGVSLKEIKQLNVELPPGRNKSLVFDGITVLDETYNASPESVKASMDLLVTKTGRHFAVLGTMMELGEQSVALHKEVAEWAVDLGLDGLVIVAEGAEAVVMLDAAKRLPRLAVVSTPKEAFNALCSWIQSGDVVLIKASRTVGLDALINFFDQSFGSKSS